MTTPPLGTIAALRRYPVKSMRGEALEAADVTGRGLPGDRAYALLDLETGAVASAKHPRKWAALLQCGARYVDEPRADAPPPPVIITLPDGATVRSDDPGVDQALSRALGRPVALIREAPAGAQREADRSPIDAPDDTPAIRREPLALGAPGTLFDYGPLHILTTATLAALRALHPAGSFAPERFRPNLLIQPAPEAAGFIELDWLGRVLAVGAVPVALFDPCPRCVVTTLPQPGLPRDPAILRTLSAHTSAASVTLAPGHVFPAVAGVYGRALSGGRVYVGDRVAG